MEQKKRKLKNVTNRRPDKKVGIKMLSDEVSKRTGFTSKDIKEVLKPKTFDSLIYNASWSAGPRFKVPSSSFNFATVVVWCV